MKILVMLNQKCVIVHFHKTSTNTKCFISMLNSWFHCLSILHTRNRRHTLYIWIIHIMVKINAVCLWLRNANVICPIKGVLHLWALFLKILCIFSKNKATSDKVSYGSGQKCPKKLENYSFTSVETIVVKLQWKMCENQYFPCFEP